MIKFPESWNNEVCEKCKGSKSEDANLEIKLKRPCSKCCQNVYSDRMCNPSYFDLISYHKENIKELVKHVDTLCESLGYEVNVEIVPLGLSTIKNENINDEKFNSEEISEKYYEKCLNGDDCKENWSKITGSMWAYCYCRDIKGVSKIEIESYSFRKILFGG